MAAAAGTTPSIGFTASIAGASAGGAGACAGGAGACADPLDDIIAKIVPTLASYYSSHSVVVAKSATLDEVQKCALFALNQLKDPELLSKWDCALYKRREQRLPRTVFVQKIEGDSLRISVFAQGAIGKGSFKRVKDLLSIDLSLSRREITISNKALCICTIVVTGLREEVKKALIEDENKKLQIARTNYKFVKVGPSFMSLEYSMRVSSIIKVTRYVGSTLCKKAGDEVEKFYTLHPRAELGDLLKSVLSMVSRGLSAPGMLKQVVAACYAGATAMSWLHSMGQVFVDFKPDNIFCFLDGRSLLGDLDSIITVVKYKSSPHNIVTASPLYIPPEAVDYILFKRGPSPVSPEKHDVWSLGISILMMAIFIGHTKMDDGDKEFGGILLPPIRGVHPYNLIKCLREADIDRTIDLAKSKQPMLAELVPLIKGMLEIDPGKRITMEAAREGLKEFSDKYPSL